MKKKKKQHLDQIYFFRYAFISYKTREEALKVFKTSQNLVVNGQEVLVTFAKAKRNKAEAEVKKNKISGDNDAGPPAKKIKVCIFCIVSTVSFFLTENSVRITMT